MPDDFHVLCQCHIVICEILQSIPVITAFRWQQFFVHQSLLDTIIMPPPLIGGGIKRWCCLTSVCLSVAYIGIKSRTERPRKTKIGTDVAHVTHDLDTTFKVKGHQAALLTAVLTRQAQAAAVVGVGTCWPWAEVAATLPSARPRARRFGANGEERGAGYIMAAARLQPVWPSLGVGRGP